MATTTMSVGESYLVSQYLDLCQALASMGHTISFSLILDLTFYFNLGINLLHLNPFYTDILFYSQIMSIVKKTTHRSSIESPKVPIKETTIESVHNEAPDIPVGNKEELHT